MLVELTERVVKLVDGREAFGFDVKFNLGDTGIIHVAGMDAPMTVSNENSSAHTTFRLSGTDMSSLLNGELNAMSAYMTGRLVVEGDLAKAMTLGSLFS